MPIICPIVGSHFRPPAKGILAALPQGQTLYLRREPDNEYDPGAIGVYLRSADIPEAIHRDLESQTIGFGFDLAAVLASPEWHLGYIAAEANKKVGHLGTAMRQELPKDWSSEDLPVELAFDMTGSPAVRQRGQSQGQS